MCAPEEKAGSEEKVTEKPSEAAETKVAESLDDAAVRAKILRQIEYYFCDASFPFDPYMQSLGNDEGFVDLAKLAAFPKMQTLTKDMAVIVDALKGTDSLEVSADAKLVRRKYPLPDADPKADRTIHVSGFAAMAEPAEAEAKVSETMSKHGVVESVRVLRDLAKDARALDGTAFVVFAEKDGAASAVAATGGVREGRKLTIYSLADWFERQKKKKEAMKKKRDSKAERDAEEAKPATITVVRGAVLKFSNLAGSTVSREDLKAACEKHATVKYVEFAREAEVGHVRFDVEGAAVKVLDGLVPGSADTKRTLRVCDVDAEVSVITGDDEDEYWARAAEAAKASRSKRKKTGGGGGGYRKKHRNN